MKSVLLIGAFQETIELCHLCGIEVVGIFDNTLIGEYLGVEILGDDASAMRANSSLKRVPAVITPDAPVLRRKLVEHYHAAGFSFHSLVSPAAVISKSATIGEGVVIQSGCNVSSAVRLGDFVRLNTNANVMHDTIIGEFTTVAPDAVLLGHVSIEPDCYIGANSTILPRKTIRQGAIVGAGAVVTKDVPSTFTVIGSPARRLTNQSPGKQRL